MVDYGIQGVDPVSQRPLYLREVSGFGVHWTFKQDEAKRMRCKEAQSVLRQIGNRGRIVGLPAASKPARAAGEG